MSIKLILVSFLPQGWYLTHSGFVRSIANTGTTVFVRSIATTGTTVFLGGILVC